MKIATKKKVDSFEKEVDSIQVDPFENRKEKHWSGGGWWAAGWGCARAPAAGEWNLATCALGGQWGNGFIGLRSFLARPLRSKSAQ